MATQAAFAELAARPDGELDVEEGAILIAAEEYPELDADEVRAELDALGDAAQERVAERRDEGQRIELLNRFLFEEQGFSGAREYYDPRNSYLNEVLERRRGIPITLALVYMGVGRRAGLDLRGISFPGHFLVRCIGHREWIVDAFHGRTLAPGEALSRLAATLGPGAPLEPERHLRDATAREILLRMLANLQRIFAEGEDFERLLSCCDRVLLLAPGNALALRERAAVYQRLGWYAAAIADLEGALASEPEEDFAVALRKRRDALRTRMGPVH